MTPYQQRRRTERLIIAKAGLAYAMTCMDDLILVVKNDTERAHVITIYDQLAALHTEIERTLEGEPS